MSCGSQAWDVDQSANWSAVLRDRLWPNPVNGSHRNTATQLKPTNPAILDQPAVPRIVLVGELVS